MENRGEPWAQNRRHLTSTAATTVAQLLATTVWEQAKSAAPPGQTGPPSAPPAHPTLPPTQQDLPHGDHHCRTPLSVFLVTFLFVGMAIGFAGNAVAAAGTDRLNPGEQLGPGERISSPDGQYVLIMQADGNTVERAPGNRPVWATETTSQNSVLRMQDDGNLVVIAPGNGATWSTGTSGYPGADLELQNDGNLAVYAPGHQAIWTSSVHGSQLTTHTRLSPGEQLGPGERISSPDGQYVLIMQADGNAVERAPGNRPVWATETTSQNSVLRVQDDGNLVVIAPGNGAAWSTGTSGYPGADLELQNDGNLAVYAPSHQAIWTSFAHGSQLALKPSPQPAQSPDDCVATNQCVATPRPGSAITEQTPGASSKEISRTDIPVIRELGRYRVGFFITQATYGLKVGSVDETGAGDGRGFDPQMGPSQNRVYLELDYTSGTARIVVDPSCNPARTECKNPVALTSGRVSISTSRANVSSDNPITFTKFHVDIENSRKAVNGFPRIRAEISFDTNPQWGLSVVGQTSSFPSVEIYHDSGAGAATAVYQHRQADIIGAAALGVPARDNSFGINVFPDGRVERAY